MWRVWSIKMKLMDTTVVGSVLSLAFLLGGVPLATSAHAPQRLLLILLDGFRYDYLNQSNVPLPGFDKVVSRGVKAEGTTPSFPTLSYPNYYTLMTDDVLCLQGLHMEYHGMTANFMYDVKRNEMFLFGGNPEQSNSHWWDGAEPLWISAIRLHKKCYMYYWPGCEVEIRGLRPTVCHNYSGIPSTDDFRFAINDSLARFQSGEADLAAIYYERVDNAGHHHGPFSTQVNQAIRDIDPIISHLADTLSETGLSEVNLMIFSDHGMTMVNPDHYINISAVLDPSDTIAIMEGGAMLSIYPVPGKEEQVISKLHNFHPNLTVYRQSDLPERWYYKHGPHVAPVTVVADLGWYILTPSAGKGYGVYTGMHGYDNVNKDMQGIFLGMGPAFKWGEKTEKLRTVDLYPIMCDILGIQPRPHNGSLSDVTPLLNRNGDISFIVSCIIVILGLCMCVMYLL